jgi:hypothetical protein
MSHLEYQHRIPVDDSKASGIAIEFGYTFSTSMHILLARSYWRDISEHRRRHILQRESPRRVTSLLDLPLENLLPGSNDGSSNAQLHYI